MLCGTTADIKNLTSHTRQVESSVVPIPFKVPQHLFPLYSLYLYVCVLLKQKKPVLRVCQQARADNLYTFLPTYVSAHPQPAPSIHFLVNITEKTLQESEDELKDILSSAIFLKPISSIRSCSILHSVEDLSTDSTCVYKNRASGYDSKRNSMRYKQQQQLHQARPQQPPPPQATDQPVGSQTTLGMAEGGGGGEAPLLGPLLLAPNELDKPVSKDVPTKTLAANAGPLPTVMSSNNMCAMVPTKGLAQNNNRGLSKSMIIPTPVCDLDEIFDEDPYTVYNATLLEKISQ